MQLGPYRVLRPLVEDSLGETYLAADGELLLRVRVLLPTLLTDPLVNQRLRALPTPLGPPPTPGHGAVGGFFPQADHSALWATAMPPGFTLAELLTQHADLPDRREPGHFTPVPEALPIALRLTAQLTVAHARGQLHLRLNPDQVFIDFPPEDGAVVSVTVVDVGLVAALGPRALTAAKPSAATSAYLAPEQRTATPVLGTEQSDVYALGILLVQLLTRQQPQDPQWQAALAQLNGATTPAGIGPLITSMLAVDPKRRPRINQVEQTLRGAAEASAAAGSSSQNMAYQGTLAGPVGATPPRENAVSVAGASHRVGPALPGGQMGNFRLVRKIGAGGMGVVYEAEHHQIGHRAAVKVLHNEFAHNPDYAKRFLNEARSVNIIRHPGLVEIFEYGQQPDGTLYIVMEFLDGESLFKRTLTPGARMAPDKVAELAVQLARALATAHEKGIIHRDQFAQSRKSVLRFQELRLPSRWCWKRSQKRTPSRNG